MKNKKRKEILAETCGKTSITLVIAAMALYVIGGILMFSSDIQDTKQAKKAKSTK